MESIRYMALIAGRHEIPQAVNGAVFTCPIKDVTDVQGLEEQARISLKKAFGLTEPSDLRTAPELVLFVTGLSVALVAVLNVCQDECIKVTLMHYNSQTGEYFEQEVR